MPHAKRRIVTALLVIGLLLLQAAWILVVPPFGGADEFDHAYRASATAHGEIFTDRGRPEDGRGLLVTVDEGIARAARAQCQVLNYPGPDNCAPVDDLGDGHVTIASAAAIYQPTYYLAVGWVTHTVDGYVALYMMRIVSALICAALWGLGVWVITGWSRSAWPLVTGLVVLTPTVLYSVSMVAPNGAEMMLAFVLWTCLIGVTRQPEVSAQGRLLLLAVPVACALAWIRPFSPIWLFLILTAWSILLGVGGIRGLLNRHLKLIVSAAFFIATAAITSARWVMTHTSGEPPRGYVIEGTRWGETLMQVPLWFLQVISGVPFRNDPATPDVYLSGLVIFSFVLLPLALARAPKLQGSVLLILVGSLGVALWYTHSRLPTAGPLWQGKYSWCLALGAVLLAALAFEDKHLHLTKTLGLVFGIPALVVMHLRALQFVLGIENGNSPLRGGEWISAPLTTVLALGALGLLAWLVGGRLAALATARQSLYRVPKAVPRKDSHPLVPQTLRRETR